MGGLTGLIRQIRQIRPIGLIGLIRQIGRIGLGGLGAEAEKHFPAVWNAGYLRVLCGHNNKNRGKTFGFRSICNIFAP